MDVARPLQNLIQRTITTWKSELVIKTYRHQVGSQYGKRSEKQNEENILEEKQKTNVKKRKELKQEGGYVSAVNFIYFIVITSIVSICIKKIYLLVRQRL